MGRPFNPVSSPTPKPPSPMVASTPPTSSRPSSPPPVRRHPHIIRPMLRTFADTPAADRHAAMRHALRQAAEFSRRRHDRNFDRRRRRTILVPRRDPNNEHNHNHNHNSNIINDNDNGHHNHHNEDNDNDNDNDNEHNVDDDDDDDDDNDNDNENENENENENDDNNNNNDNPRSVVVRPSEPNPSPRRYVRLLREPPRVPRARRPGHVSAPLPITPAVIPPAASSVHQFAYSILSMHLSRCSQWLRAEKRASSRLLSDTSRFPNNPHNPDDPFYAYYNAFCDAYFDSLIQSNDRLQSQIRQRLADPTNDPRFPHPIPFSEQSVRAFANDVARDVAALNSNAVEAVLRISRDPPSSILPLNPAPPRPSPTPPQPVEAPTNPHATAPAPAPSTTIVPPTNTGNTAASEDNPETAALDPWWLRCAFSRIQNLQQQSNDMLEAIEATTAQSRAAAEQLSSVCRTYAQMVSRLGRPGDPTGAPLRLGSAADTASDSDEGVPEGDITPDSQAGRDSELDNDPPIGPNPDVDAEATGRVSMFEGNELAGWVGVTEGNSGDDDQDD